MKELITRDRLNEIQKMDRKEVAKKVGSSLTFIARDLGIRETLTGYDKARFINYIVKYYKFLTLNDIKLMFELFVVGKLEGVKDHYGRWSADFYISVVKAYITLQGKERMKHQLALPAPEVTEDQKKKITGAFEQTMIRDFERLENSGRIRKTMFNMTVYEYWAAKGLIPEAEITQRDVAIATKEMGEEAAGKAFPAEITPEQKQNRAKAIAHYRTIRELYRGWIEQGKSIKEFIQNEKNDNTND